MAGPDLPAILQLLRELGGLIHKQMSDPVKDQQRIGRLNAGYELAKAGDESPRESLEGLSGRAYIDRIAADEHVPEGGSAGGSKVAVAYAHVLKLKLLVHAGELAGDLPA